MTALPASIEQALHSDLLAQRSPAWLRIDAALGLAGAGGCLAHYGLGELRIGAPAASQAAFLEGMLPLAESPLLIHAVELSGGRAADLHFHAHGDQAWVVLLDVTAERNESRLVQQKAYEMTLMQEKEAQLNRRLEAANEALRVAHRELEASRAALQRAHDRLSQGLKEAADYVRSMLPSPMSRPFDIDWRFLPSTQLGGDAFGYHWIDERTFALYLLDVCGHGIGPSLLSVAVLDTLRSGSLANVDLRDPAQVLAGLNRVYRMEEHYDLYFTLWYGVYVPAARRLDYAAAGHPPALLISPGGHGVQRLASRGAPIGTVAHGAWRSESVNVAPRSSLYLLSDGAFEILGSDGTMLSFDSFVDFVRSLETAPGGPALDRLLAFIREQGGARELDDDLSIVRFGFQP